MEIHQTRRFAKQFDALATAGKNERDAGRRAEEVISRLRYDPCDTAAENKRTHHGEQRLDRCRKYDIGCGFRLVAVKRGSRLIFTCIGSHDDCQRWLENNRGEDLDELKSEPVPAGFPVTDTGAERAVPAGAMEEKDEYEEKLMARIDDLVLREIFTFDHNPVRNK
jgi:mRNA-degrading endonuclease YafQ of YafQ-DinJ toxin-antitoxin module